MMLTRGDLWNIKTVAILVACAWGCSSSGGGPKTGTAGSSPGTAGSTGDAGMTGAAGTAGGAGAAGTAGTAGSAGGAGDSGSAGAAGTAGGGASGSAGATTDGSAPDGAAGGGSASDAAAGSLKLTSTAFMEGGMIPVQSSCAGAGTSPELAWTSGPATTKGYAIVLKDNTNNLTHWAIWDIPPSVMELAMGLATNTHTLADPAGAKQVNGGGGIGYLPPCPPKGSPHTYVFTVYAQSALPLANAQTTQNAQAIMARLATQNVGMATLSAKFTQ